MNSKEKKSFHSMLMFQDLWISLLTPSTQRKKSSLENSFLMPLMP